MNKPLILVVEDDAPVRNLITTTLKTHDYKYLSAPTIPTSFCWILVFRIQTAWR